MMFRRALTLALVVFCATQLLAQNPKKSTPEERQLWADALHEFEKNPLNEQVQAAAAKAANRLQEVDDVTIAPCGIFAELPNKWNKSWGVVIYLLGLSAYQVETGKSDASGENLYAVRSVLKAYAAAVAKDPSLKDKKLEALTKVDADGKLPELIAKKGC